MKPAYIYIMIDNYWWELKKYKNEKNRWNYRVENSAGGGYDLQEKQFPSIRKKYKLDIAESRSELDWYGTDVYDNEKYETGWLDPQGNFYGCEYRCHSCQADYVHKCDERDLEEKGWIKLTYDWGNANKPLILYNHNTKPTKKQLDYIAGTNFRKNDMFDYLMEFCYE